MFCLATGAVIFVVAIVYIVLDTIMRSLKVCNITDKYVFINGWLSRAKQLDKLGFYVFAGCLTKEGAKSVTESCSSRVTTVELDIRRLWALLNNAGVLGRCAPAEMCSREDIQEALSVNLLGPIDVTRHFLPLIRKVKGRIVITTSMGARVAILPIPYTVSKYGLNGFSDRLRREVWRQGIKVSIVEPGAFRTQILIIDKCVQEVQEVYDKHSPDIQATYGGPKLMNMVRNVLSSTKSGALEDLRLVVNANVHAITSRFPRTRYRPGWDAVWFYNPVTYLSDSLADLVLGPAA
ncbi:unnamed protein product [Candidula unifasciata]|uniref:Uncharacterized protein n=1 Tax=Candidula unifasciata TaxID=100452 RepID=A0A8S3YYT2_9EUPU|nr:unnamed protein product [Candidula unifasciata]